MTTLPFVRMLTGWFLSSFSGMVVLRIVRGSVTSVGLERAELLWEREFRHHRGYLCRCICSDFRVALVFVVSFPWKLKNRGQTLWYCVCACVCVSLEAIRNKRDLMNDGAWLLLNCTMRDSLTSLRHLVFSGLYKLLCVIIIFFQCFGLYSKSLVGSVSRGLPGTSIISELASCAGFPAEGHARLRANAPGSESARTIACPGQPREWDWRSYPVTVNNFIHPI